MGGPWDSQRVAAIALGGVLGTALRWGVLTLFATREFPWPVLLVNAAGSVLLGVLLAEEWSHPRARLLLHDFGGIGLCGGLTTFSTFSLEWSTSPAAVAHGRPPSTPCARSPPLSSA